MRRGEKDSPSSRRARLCAVGLGLRARPESGGGTCLQRVEEEWVFQAVAAHRFGGTEVPKVLPHIIPSLSPSLPSLSLRWGLLLGQPRSL